ncbi:MAG: alginate lyase family protein [Phycisphaerae bacterium]
MEHSAVTMGSCGLVILAVCLLCSPLGAQQQGGEGAEKAGEFSIPPVVPLDAAQLKRLRDLAADDREAAALAAEAAEKAKGLLSAQPHPLEVIHYEGLVHTDPRRIATVAKLREMGDVARLVRYWQVSADARAAETLRKFILAWTGTYKLTGNDVNENKFWPMLVAYHALRDSFPGERRKQVDAWVEHLGRLHVRAVEKSEHLTNRYSKHVRLAAMAGMILGRKEWVATAHEGIRRFVTESLYADGTSRDLKRRDTLTYHASSLRPPLQLAMLAGAEGRKLYAWQSEKGGSLEKSVDYVVPYAMGEKTRREWTRSKVDLDRRRAEAGLDEYEPGRLYEPRRALKLMEQASYFDADLLKVVLHLTASEAKRFPTWQTLINAAARPPADAEDPTG